MIVIIRGLNVMLVVVMVRKFGVCHMVVLMAIECGVGIVMRQVVLHFVSKRISVVVAIGVSIFVR